MKRKEFIKKAVAAGVSVSFLSLFLESCTKEDKIDFPQFNTDFTGKVIIVGAGAAGMAAGYLLSRYGVDFQIIEASSIYGGRVKRTTNLGDYPIDLGAEWIHGYPTLLSSILDDPSLNASLDFVSYNPQTFKTWQNGKLRSHNYASNFYSEYKFKHSTWFGFFEQFMAPHFQDKLVLNQPITEINYSSNKIQLTSIDGTTYEADKVLVTTSIKILQEEKINFIPALPVGKTKAINNVFMGDGLKVFIEFKERFYPDMLFTDKLFKSLSSDEKIFYDAAFRKDSSHHVMGLFTVNSKATSYTQLNSDQEIFETVMNELDTIFDGKASQFYVQHEVQNWSKEEYVNGSYSSDFNGDQQSIVDDITAPIDTKIYFAGEALSIDNQATVHGACESGYAAIKKMLS